MKIATIKTNCPNSAENLHMPIMIHVGFFSKILNIT